MKPNPPINELVLLQAHQLAERIRLRQVSCREVMQAYLAHIERFNPRVNALVSLLPAERLLEEADARDGELARGEWRGWMHGLPHAIKDLSLTRGIRTTLGSPLYRDYIPERDGIMVERIRAAGAILIGKTNTPEFGLGSQTYNPLFGATACAYDERLSAGGSSGGAAAALALHLVPVADGSDMMGSLRNPAAFNNVIGFRPSQGRVPFDDSADLFFDQLGYEGPMGRSALRHWLVAGSLGGVHADPAKRALLKPEALWEVENGLRLGADAVFRASVIRSDWYRAIGRLFERYDYLLLPSAQVFPFAKETPWPRSIEGVAMDTYHRWMEVVVPGSLSGCPVANVQAGFNAEGLPMGLQIIGPHQADFAVLQLAHAYERASRWFESQPSPLLAN